jgi:hypothetical protein
LFRAVRSQRISSAAIALTIPTRYARRRARPQAQRNRGNDIGAGIESAIAAGDPSSHASASPPAAPPDSEASMTTFDKREEGFEKQFARDEELRFKANARRNKLFGLWAAEKLGLAGAQADAYAKEVIMADFEEAGDNDVFRKIRRDFDAKGVTQSDHQIRRTMDELMAQAVAEIKASG